jgi:hypothetical protein
MEKAKYVKPPLGLKPKHIDFEIGVSYPLSKHKQRYEEVKAAILRYLNADLEIPNEWLAEYNVYVSYNILELEDETIGGKQND